MPRSLGELLDEQGAALVMDPAWLGSAAHRQWLENVVREIPDFEDITVAWVPPGNAGYWEASTRTIGAEKPVPIAGFTRRYIAKMALLGVVHETLHARYSTPTPAFQRRLLQVEPPYHQPIGRLFNVLEDGRITMLGKTAAPDTAPQLDEFVRESFDQMRMSRPASAETTTPVRPSDQLFFALVAYALSADAPSPLHPDVDEALDGMLATIDATRHGTTDDCGLAAITLVMEAAKFRPASR